MNGPPAGAGPGDPARARRAAAVAALLVWCALLLLSAWPERVLLTRLLERPAKRADALLGRAALVGGIAVFDPTPERMERVAIADCIWVWRRDPDGAARLLHPPRGKCQLSGLRLSIPRLEWVQRDLLLRGTAPLNQVAIGDYWCRHAGGAMPEAIDVLWTEPYFERETGARARTNVAFFRWRCVPPGLPIDLRMPSDADLARLGAVPPQD